MAQRWVMRPTSSCTNCHVGDQVVNLTSVRCGEGDDYFFVVNYTIAEWNDDDFI